VGLNPRRCALLNVLRRMGARIAVTPAADGTACEELGSVTVAGGRLRGAEVGPDEAPDLIDELPLVAMAGALAQGQTVIRGAAELRVKESDRIAIIAGLLNRLGVNVEELPDGMIVHGGSRIRGAAAVESHGDHRIPMALTVLALAADQPLEMRDVACVNKSYPEFWSDLQRLGGRVEFHPSH
jgi:3-phosphoshikimate 1-carboxyvinyltransferase